MLDLTIVNIAAGTFFVRADKPAVAAHSSEEKAAVA
jgi:hypothetical protein